MEVCAVDIETYDPLLKQRGAGSISGQGYIIGVGLYMPHRSKFYTKLELELKRVLEDPNIIKVFHNGVYDLDWLCNGQWKCKVNGRIEDTMTRETLIHTYAQSFSLDNCCKTYGIKGKYKEGIETYYKGKGKAVANLDKIPIDIVGQYCLADCEATYNLYQQQQPFLEKEELEGVNDCECDLYPIVIEMRKNGIRIDLPKIYETTEVLTNEYNTSLNELSQKYNISNLSLSKSADLVKIFNKENIPIKYTEKGHASFTSDILADIEHPVAKQIYHTRATQKLISTFLKNWPEMAINGRLHCTLYPSKRDVGGTVTGRWSSQNPNLQQVPAREDKHGTLFRSLFLPDEGCLLGAFDYKQIEYRVFLHFALGKGAEITRQAFQIHPDIDYHQMTVDMLEWGDLGKEGRHLAKCLNFGVLYGLGARSFAYRFKHALLDNHPERKEEDLLAIAQSLLNEYYLKVPFVRPTIKGIEQIGYKRGYVKTVLGRRQRMPPDQKAYKLVNYLIQGTASDIIKQAMVNAYKAKIFDVLKIHFPVHDELVFSIPQTKEGYQACLELQNIMTSVFQLRVPLGVDTEIGEDWGHCNKENFINFGKRWI